MSARFFTHFGEVLVGGEGSAMWGTHIHSERMKTGRTEVFEWDSVWTGTRKRSEKNVVV